MQRQLGKEGGGKEGGGEEGGGRREEGGGRGRREEGGGRRKRERRERKGEEEKEELGDACFRHELDWAYHFWVSGVHHLLQSLLPTRLHPGGKQHRHVPIPRHLPTTSHHGYQQCMVTVCLVAQ